MDRWWVAAGIVDSETHLMEIQINWLRAATRLPKLRSFVCHPTLVVPAVMVGGLKAYGGEPDYPDRRVERFARDVAGNFEKTHDINFKIFVWVKPLN